MDQANSALLATSKIFAMCHLARHPRQQVTLMLGIAIISQCSSYYLLAPVKPS